MLHWSEDGLGCCNTSIPLSPSLITDVLLICGVIYPIWVRRGVIDWKCKEELNLFTPVLQFLLLQKNYYFPFSAVTLIAVAVVCVLALPVSLLGEYLTWCVTCKQLFVPPNKSGKKPIQSRNDMIVCKPLGNQGLISHAFNSQTMGRTEKKNKTNRSASLLIGPVAVSHTQGVLNDPFLLLGFAGSLRSCGQWRVANLPCCLCLSGCTQTWLHVICLSTRLPDRCMHPHSFPDAECIELSELMSNHKFPLWKTWKHDCFSSEAEHAWPPVCRTACLLDFAWIPVFFGFAHSCLSVCLSVCAREQPAALRGKMRVQR